MKFPRSVFENTLQMERPQKVDYVSASNFLVKSTGITLNPAMVQTQIQFLANELIHGCAWEHKIPTNSI